MGKRIRASSWKKAGSYPRSAIPKGGRVSGRVKQDTASCPRFEAGGGSAAK